MINQSVTEQLEEMMAAVAPWMGGYSIGNHFVLCLVMMALGLGAIAVFVKLRGQPPQLAANCIRDMLLGCLFLMTVLFFPIGVYLVGKAFYQAIFSQAYTTS